MVSDSGSYSLPMALAVGFVGLVMLIYVFFMIHCSVESKSNAEAVAWSKVRLENLIAKENELKLYQASTNSKIENLQTTVLELQGTLHKTTLTQRLK